MGKKLVVSGFTSSDINAPKLPTIDGILPDAGALLFLEPGHPARPLVGVPGQNGLVPNLAFAQAQAMVPAGSDVSLGGVTNIGSKFTNDGVSSKAERTSKGGLHLMSSRTNVANDLLRFFNVAAGSDINAYILANKGHSFYFSTWGRSTLPPLANTSGAPVHTQGHASVLTFYSRPGGSGATEYPTGAKQINHYGEGVLPMVAGAPHFQDNAITDASALTGTANVVPFYFQEGLNGEYGKLGAQIFYGFYAEDLTVSGRSYAAVDALVKAKYTKEVKTAGGRYFGDTWTAPIA